MNPIQLAALNYLREKHPEYSQTFVVRLVDLLEYLQSNGLVVRKEDIVPLIQELQRLKTGLVLEKVGTDSGIEELFLIWKLSPAQRTKLWRVEQAKLGRKAKTIYLTEEEFEKVMTYVDFLRSRL